MAFERKNQPLASKRTYFYRQMRYAVYAFGIIVISLGIGTLGYHYYDELSVLDGFYNASMILTGMGPVNPMVGPAAKIFSSLYAIFSGVAFLTTISILLSPAVHRFLHQLHLDEKDWQ
jgi:hypothetical protein